MTYSGELFSGAAVRDPDQINIFLNGNYITGWCGLSITEGVGMITEAEFTAPIAITHPLYRLLAPFNDLKVEIVMGPVSMVGRIRRIIPEFEVNKDHYRFYCVDNVSLLAESNPPPTVTGQSSINFTNSTFLTICSYVADVWGIEVTAPDSFEDFAVKEFKIDAKEVAWDKLLELAVSNNVMMRSAEGSLFVSKLKDFPATYVNNLTPMLDMDVEGIVSGTIDISDSEAVAQIVVLRGTQTPRKADTKAGGTTNPTDWQSGASPSTESAASAAERGFLTSVTESRVIIENPWKSSTFCKTKTIDYDPKSGVSIEEFAEAAMARSLASSLTWTFQVSGWRAPDGNTWYAGKIGFVNAAALFIYGQTLLVVDKVEFVANAGEMNAKITCKLPCLYTGKLPTYDAPWSDTWRPSRGMTPPFSPALDLFGTE